MNLLEELTSLIVKNLPKERRKLTKKQKEEYLMESNREEKKSTIRKKYDSQELVYWLKPNFITGRELDFFRKLEILIGDKYYIIPQVHLSHILETLEKPVHLSFNPYFNRINVLSFDFCLFNKSDFSFKLAIELDDTTHDMYERIERDAFVEAIMKKADMKLVRMNSFDVEKVLFYL